MNFQTNLPLCCFTALISSWCAIISISASWPLHHSHKLYTRLLQYRITGKFNFGRMPYLSVTSYLCQSQHNIISLVPRPPPFSTSVCVYNNTWERKTGIFIFHRSSNSVYFYERKETIKTGEAWDRDYNIIILFTSSPPCLSN